MNDASRSVPVAQKAKNKDFKEETKENYTEMRANHKGKKVELVTIEQARANKIQLDFNNYKPLRPRFLGKQVFENIELKNLIPFIDWTPVVYSLY